jgi:hypothetical protein
MLVCAPLICVPLTCVPLTCVPLTCVPLTCVPLTCALLTCALLTCALLTCALLTCALLICAPLICVTLINHQVLITEGRGRGQISRIFGYTAEDCTIDVMLETEPDASSSYSITRLEGFEVGDDEYSWGVASSVSGR